MNKIVVDPATLNKLLQFRHALDLCDDSGRVVGHFIPVLDHAEYRGKEPQISEEELDRRERAGGGRALHDILADLEKRA